MLELYIRFRFWPYCRHRHMVRHRLTNFLAELDDTYGSGDVILIFQDDRTASQIYFRFPVSSRITLKKLKKLFARQISTRYFNPHYYLRFLKTNRSYIEILLPIFSLTIRSSSACDSASTYQILSELDDRRQSYNVISIFQDGGHGVANLLPFSALVTYPD